MSARAQRRREQRQKQRQGQQRQGQQRPGRISGADWLDGWVAQTRCQAALTEPQWHQWVVFLARLIEDRPPDEVIGLARGLLLEGPRRVQTSCAASLSLTCAVLSLRSVRLAPGLWELREPSAEEVN